MDPLLTLGTLSTDIEHAVRQVTNDEGGLGDTSSLDTGAEDILIVGDVVGLCNAVNRVEVVLGGVVQLVLARPAEALLNTLVLPEGTNGVANLRGEAVTFDLCWLHEDGLNVVLVAGVGERELQRLHGLEDDTHGLNSVAEDDFLERFTLVPRVTTLVDQLHPAGCQ